MIKLTFLMFLLAVSSCSNSEQTYLLGNNGYKIPAVNLVEQPSIFDGAGLDSSSDMVAITFNFDEGFKEFLQPKSWLPGESITALLLSTDKNKLVGINPDLTQPIPFTVKEMHVKEFVNSYRIFEGNTRISWMTVPKAGLTLNGDDGEAIWVAKCIPLGGMKGSDLSRESSEIPTSCNINVKYKNLVLSLTTSEQNLLGDASRIIKKIISRLDSWVQQ